MADMPNDFWSGYIIVITVVSFVVLAWLVYDIYFRSGRREEVTDYVWDGNLREGNRPAPLWWFWLIFALMAFSVVYLILYPGLGSFRGALRWSQGSELAAVREDYEARFGARRAEIRDSDLAALTADPEALRSARHLFGVHCAACHGEDATGQVNLFPDLTDSAWLWGNSEAQLTQTLTAGRQGVMPPWQQALGDDGVAAVTEYVRALADGEGDSDAVAEGRSHYQMFCVACHGADGGGNAMLGAPALDDDIWVYGGDLEAIRVSIAEGRMGQMPAFGETLDATQIRLLVAWLTAGAPMEPGEPTTAGR